MRNDCQATAGLFECTGKIDRCASHVDADEIIVADECGSGTGESLFFVYILMTAVFQMVKGFHC